MTANVTTTPVNACDTTVYLDTHLGVATDISGMSNSISFEITNALGEYNVFGGVWMMRMACKLDGSLELGIVMSKDSDGAHRLLSDWIFTYNKEARRVIFFLPTEAIGNDRYEGYYLIENYTFDVSADEAGPIICTASLKPNGPIYKSVATT
jgi:hypothetical protein